MSSKRPAIDQKASNVLLFMSKCAKATRHLAPPPGTQLTFRLTASTKKTAEILHRAQEMQTAALKRLEQAIRAADRAQRVVSNQLVRAKQSAKKKSK